MPAFSTPLDIANRALQLIGQPRMTLWTDNSVAAAEMRFAFDKLRQAELRRNVWRFSIARSAIYPVSTTTRTWVPPAYNAATTYPVGAVVSYLDTYGRTLLWSSAVTGNVGNLPGSPGVSQWEQYFGPLIGDLWNEFNIATAVTATQAYYAGDIVYLIASDGVFNFYRSLVNSNQDSPVVTDLWTAFDENNDPVYYQTGAIISYNGTDYSSKIDENTNIIPGTDASAWLAISPTNVSYNWVALNGTSNALAIVYPIDVGPVEQTASRNAFQLPYGYMREASQDPKAGSISILGAPSNRQYDDFELEGNYLISQDPGPIVYRHVQDVADPSKMDAMFCEGLALRLAHDLCEIITQSSEKKTGLMRDYIKFMTEARIVNSIEVDSDEPPLDDWLNCRQ